MHDTRYVPLFVATDFFIDLSVNDLSLLELPSDVLDAYMHAWDDYIARISERAASNDEMGELAAYARLRRGFGALIQGNAAAAIADADWVVRERREKREIQTAHLLRAYACGDAGDAGDIRQYEQALLDWGDVISLFEQSSAPESTRLRALSVCYLERALLHGELFHYAQVVEDCNRAEQCEKPSATLLSARGLARGYLGDEQGAIEDCTHSIEMEETADSYFRRGCLLSHFGRFDEALADLGRALELAHQAADIGYALRIARLRSLCRSLDGGEGRRAEEGSATRDERSG